MPVAKKKKRSARQGKRQRTLTARGPGVEPVEAAMPARQRHTSTSPDASRSVRRPAVIDEVTGMSSAWQRFYEVLSARMED